MLKKDLQQLGKPELIDRCMTFAKIIEVEIPRMKIDIELLKKDSEALKGVREVLEKGLFPTLKKLQELNKSV